jgi:hypothetical protein
MRSACSAPPQLSPLVARKVQVKMLSVTAAEALGSAEIVMRHYSAGVARAAGYQGGAESLVKGAGAELAGLPCSTRPVPPGVNLF